MTYKHLQVPDAEIEEAADMLAAALQYNNLPPEEGFAPPSFSHFLFRKNFVARKF